MHLALLKEQFVPQKEHSNNPFLEVICLVDEVEVSENKEALIALAGTVAGRRDIVCCCVADSA